jgi:hypothetical protein
MVLAICLTLFVLGLVTTHHVRPYNSDDVSWQNILLTWHPFSGEQVTLGSSDNFVDKLPIFMLFNQILEPTRSAILIESAILGVIGFSLFYVSSIYFLAKAKIKLTYINLLPFVWLASFGHSFSQLYLLPDWRGFELGFAFALIALVAKACSLESVSFRSPKIVVATLFASVLSGIIIYSDPYFLYFTLAPLVIAVIVLAIFKKIGLRVFGLILAGFVLAYLSSKLTEVISHSAGIKLATEYPVQFVNFDQLPSNIWHAVHSVLIIFGADFFGRPPFSAVTIAYIVNAILLALIIRYLYVTGQTSKNLPRLDPAKCWRLYFALLCLLVFTLYSVSTVQDGTSTYRYFIIFVLSSVLLLSLVMGQLRDKRILACLLILASLLNIGVMIKSPNTYPMPGASGNNHNQVNYDIIKTVKDENLSKGYANYWQGAINTYLSKNKITFLPAYCFNGQALKFHWLIDESTFSRKADRTFYLYDPLLPITANCTPDEVRKHFGKPAETLTVDGKTLYIYEYDISSKLK